MNTNEFFEALSIMEKEKGIPAEYLAEKISTAIVVAAKREYGGNDIVFCDINTDKRSFKVYARKTVVEEITNPDTEILLPEASKYSKRSKIGETVDIKIETKKFGRILAQTAKHVIRQGIREAENGLLLEEFQSRQHEIISAVVQSIDPRTGNATLEIGKNEAILPRTEQLERDILDEGQHIRVYVVDARETEKGPKIMISRTHPGFVKKLFEIEVPEIQNGIIEIKSISREAGSRTKIAVYTTDEEIDAVGSCIGPKGARVTEIVEELCGEKIDIVQYSEDPAEYVTEALSPANVISVEIEDEKKRACRATVPDNQLSLAIGNRGQNARLAAKLTGWKIDIHPESGFAE